MVSAERLRPVGDQCVARYDLSADEVSTLTNDLLERHPATEEGRYAIYLVDGLDSYSNLGRIVEVEVFDAAFGNDPATMRNEYGIYEPFSSFIVVVDRVRSTPVGTLRTIRNSTAGLKTLVDIAKPPLGITEQELTSFHHVAHLDSCWDVGTLAVAKEARGTASDSMVSTAMYRTLYTEAMKNGVEHLISIIDQRAYENLKLLGVPFVPILRSDYFSYLSSNRSMAVYGHVTDFFDRLTSYCESLDPHVREVIGPYLSRLMFGTDVPAPVSVGSGPPTHPWH